MCVGGIIILEGCIAQQTIEGLNLYPNPTIINIVHCILHFVLLYSPGLSSTSSTTDELITEMTEYNQRKTYLILFVYFIAVKRFAKQLLKKSKREMVKICY